METLETRKHPILNVFVRSDGWVYRPALCNRKACWTPGYADDKGYRCIRIDGKIYKVHRIVAETFIPNPDGLYEIDHINRDRSDNSISNLRWATRKKNCRNTVRGDACEKDYGVHKYEDSKRYNAARARKYMTTSQGRATRKRAVEKWKLTHRVVRCADRKYHRMPNERAEALLKLPVCERFV